MNSQIKLHFIVLIWGFTAILGHLISLEAVSLVWFRMGLAIVFFLGYLLVAKIPFNVSKKSLLALLGTGTLIALHWITFFHAIKISNISVTLACMSAGSFFGSLLEPIFYKRKIDFSEMVMGILVIIGISTIFAVETQFFTGIIVALISAFLSALFSVINGIHVKKGLESTSITVWEMIGGWLFVGVFILFTQPLSSEFFARVTPYDWGYLIILGSVATAYPFLESVRVMKDLSPFTVLLTINLEPVYGILLAFLLFGDTEKMTPAFYLGGATILIAVVFNGVIKRIKKNKAKKQGLRTE